MRGRRKATSDAHRFRAGNHEGSLLFIESAGPQTEILMMKFDPFRRPRITRLERVVAEMNVYLCIIAVALAVFDVVALLAHAAPLMCPISTVTSHDGNVQLQPSGEAIANSAMILRYDPLAAIAPLSGG